MKILVIGDFHGKFPKKLKKIAKECDFILSTGDLGGSDKLLKIIFKYLGQCWWKEISMKKAKKYVLEDYNSGKRIIRDLSSLGKPTYVISGNWDFDSKQEFERTAKLNLKMYPQIIRKSKNLSYWRRGLKRVKDFRILSFGGQVTAGEYTNKKGFFKNNKKKLAKNIKTNDKETKQILSYGVKNLDILFAHYPPYGIFDKVKYKGYNPMKGKHVGFKGYTEYIKKFQPKIFVCGHMHEYQGMKKLGRTKIIATGAAKDGKAVILNYDKSKKNFKVEFIK